MLNRFSLKIGSKTIILSEVVKQNPLFDKYDFFHDIYKRLIKLRTGADFSPL